MFSFPFQVVKVRPFVGKGLGRCLIKERSSRLENLTLKRACLCCEDSHRRQTHHLEWNGNKPRAAATPKAVRFHMHGCSMCSVVDFAVSASGLSMAVCRFTFVLPRHTSGRMLIPGNEYQQRLLVGLNVINSTSVRGKEVSLNDAIVVVTDQHHWRNLRTKHSAFILVRREEGFSQNTKFMLGLVRNYHSTADSHYRDSYLRSRDCLSRQRSCCGQYRNSPRSADCHS